MRIALSTDRVTVSAHFGRCPAFASIDIEEGKGYGLDKTKCDHSENDY